jgi:MoxR-like ATPase
MTQNVDAGAVRAEVEQFRASIARLKDEIAHTIVGNHDVVDGVLMCLLAGGHALLEGVPGLGKTMLVRTLAEALSLQFSRIQFTPDLMPADILGTTVIDDTQQGGKVFEFRKGPVFANIVLAERRRRPSPRSSRRCRSTASRSASAPTRSTSLSSSSRRRTRSRWRARIPSPRRSSIASS